MCRYKAGCTLLTGFLGKQLTEEAEGFVDARLVKKFDEYLEGGR